VADDHLLTIGVRGRVVDLCQPAARKYETAVSVVLGRNIDAIVVDEEKTAIDCIEVLVLPDPSFEARESHV
jgi:chromosome segregation ATPase